MSKKVLTGAMAAIMATGMVTPAFAATTDELYVAAYEAMEKAVAEKTQAAINEFRAAAKEVLAVEGLSQEAKNNIATWSTMVDEVQLPFMVKVVDGLKALEAGDFKQADVNALYELIKDMPEQYKNGANYGWSQQTDAFQMELVMTALEAVEKAVTAEEIAAAEALVADLKTSVNTDAATAAGKMEATLVEKATVNVEKVEVVGAKKVLVTFNKAIDTTKAVVTMKKGSVSTNLDKVTPADDKMSVLVETTTKLTAGDYTVTVSGLTETLTATVKAADEKVADINVLTTTAPMVSGNKTKATVKYEILNQYGENVTNATNIAGTTWTSSTGKEVVKAVSQGVLTIEAASGDFIPNSKVYLTGVHATSGTVVNAEVTVGLESKVDSIQFKGVYNKDTSKIEALPAGFAANKYVLLFEAKDQYGNKMNLANHSDLVFTSNNPLFVTTTSNAADVTIDDVVYEAISLVRGTAVGNGGTATVQAISTVTGKTASFTIEADALSSVKTFAISAPEVMVSEGETVELKFSAEDQYGKAITKYDDLNGKVNLTGGLFFEPQNDGTAKLKFRAPLDTNVNDNVDTPCYVTALVPNGGSFSSLMINVKEKARATTIVGLKSDVATTLAKGATATIKAEHLLVQDQYGRNMDVSGTKLLDNNIVKVTSSNEENVSLNGSHIVDEDGVIVTANKKGSSTLTFTLVNSNGVLTSSAKAVTFNVVEQSAYTSYEVADLGVMYNAGGDHAKTVKVYGIQENGTKVLLPQSVNGAAVYTVVTNASEVTFNGQKLVANYAATAFEDKDGNYKGDKTVQVLVTVNDGNGAAAAIIEKELVVSNKAPKVETITLDGDKVSNGKTLMTTSGGALSTGNLTSVIKELKDQYGVLRTEQPTITITNLVKVDGSGLTVTGNGTTGAAITGAIIGDKFTVTYKYASGKTVSVEFTVGRDTSVTRTISVAQASIVTITN